MRASLCSQMKSSRLQPVGVLPRLPPGAWLAMVKSYEALVHTCKCISARTDEELQGAASGGAAEAAARGVGGDGVRGRSRGPGSPPPRQASGWSLSPAPSGLGECLHELPFFVRVFGVTGSASPSLIR